MGLFVATGENCRGFNPKANIPQGAEMAKKPLIMPVPSTIIIRLTGTRLRFSFAPPRVNAFGASKKGVNG